MSSTSAPAVYIHELTIENFRGIKSFQDRFDTGLNAIIGAGDNGKTTILDALATLFHPNWSLNLTDNDFYDGNPEKNPILIRATIANPPEELTSDKAFFEYLRGIDHDTGEIVDEPDDHTPALTCELTVGADFEPIWKIVCDRHSDGVALSAARRQRFGVRRIDASTHHLKWVPNSALHQLSEKPDGKSADTVLREVSRTARTAAKAGLTPFDTSIQSITDQARLLRAASASSSFSAELDADLTALTRGSISLHMDDLPVGRVGLGSRRLVTIGVQSLAQSGAHILLIDELESGLEPHRTRHLIRYLQRTDDRQIILTTHSPSVVRELSYNQLKITRRTNTLTTTDGSTAGGAVTLITPPEEAQGAIRTHADGLLAPRVLVCEGATEVGFIRELCNRLEEVNPARMSHIATVSADTDSQVVPTAKVFEKLGYEVAIFCDADNPDRKLAKDIATLNGTSIKLLQCDPGKAIEHQTLGALTAEGIRHSIQYAIDAVGRDVVLDSLHKAGISPEVKKAFAKQEPVASPEQYRDQVITAAGTGKWFKSVGRGQMLAEIVLDPQLTTMTEDLETFLDKLRDWCAPA